MVRNYFPLPVLTIRLPVSSLNLMERRQSTQILCAHVVESWVDFPCIENVEFKISESEIMAVVADCEGREKRFVFDRKE